MKAIYWAAVTVAILASGAANCVATIDMLVKHNQAVFQDPYASSVIVPPGYTTFYLQGPREKGRAPQRKRQPS